MKRYGYKSVKLSLWTRIRNSFLNLKGLDWVGPSHVTVLVEDTDGVFEKQVVTPANAFSIEDLNDLKLFVK